jgi:hypothetical protein
MKSRAGAILRAGGVPLSGGAAGGSDAGTGPSADAGVDRNDAGGTTPDAGSTPTDSARYNFEAGNQSWLSGGAPITSVASSAARAFAGTKSLAVTLSGAGSASAYVKSPAATAGNVISFRVFIPSGNAIASIQPYAMQGATGGWAWTGAWRAGSSLTANAWNTISITLPSNAKALDQIGVEFTTNAGANATAYVDSVTW